MFIRKCLRPLPELVRLRSAWPNGWLIQYLSDCHDASIWTRLPKIDTVARLNLLPIAADCEVLYRQLSNSRPDIVDIRIRLKHPGPNRSIKRGKIHMR